MNLIVYKQLKNNYENSKSPKKDLENLRVFLDTNGFKMPKPLYRYSEEDISTWKYLDGNINKHKITGRISYTEVFNPRFSPVKVI